MYLHWTGYRTGCAVVTPAFSLAGKVVLRGLAQIAFSDTPVGGILVLVAIACVSPWSACGALLGAVAGTAAGYALAIYPRYLWELGLSGYNAAIVGIFWGGLFANGTQDIPFFLLALVLCVLLEMGLKRVLGLLNLPVLSLPAVLTGYIITGLYVALGHWFWVAPPPLPFGFAGVFVAIACIIVVMSAVSMVACLQVVALCALSAVVGSLIFHIDIMALWGLWAFTVAPASFAIHAIFLAETPTASLAGILAALVGAIIWITWLASGLGSIVPPLLLPFIIASWVSIIMFRRSGSPAAL